MGYIKYQTLVNTFYFGSNLSVTNQTFGGVVDEKGVFDNALFDGIVGFSYKALGTPPGITPIFNNVMKQKKLQNNIFALFVARNSRHESKFWLGGINLQYIKNADQNQITWHKVIERTWWTLKLDKVLIDGVDSGLCKEGATVLPYNCGIIMDSGTSSMAAPIQTFDKFHSLLTVKGKYNEVKSWPDLTFVIDGRNYVLPGYAYLYVDQKITYQKENDSNLDLV